MKPWKLAEKQVAKVLGGLRRHRVSYSESIEDVLHPYYSVEVKYGKQVPKCCRVKKPTVIKSGRRWFLLIPDGFWKSETSSEVQWIHLGGPMVNKRVKFLEKAMDQAASYSEDKIPIVGLKPRRCRGVIIVEEMCS